MPPKSDPTKLNQNKQKPVKKKIEKSKKKKIRPK